MQNSSGRFGGATIKTRSSEDIRARKKARESQDEQAQIEHAVRLAAAVELAVIRVREEHEASKGDEPSAAAAEPVPAVPAKGTGKIWDADRLAKLSAYRTQHGTKKAAEHFGVTPSRVRPLLPTAKPATKG